MANVTLGGTKVVDTLSAIEIVKTFELIDQKLGEQNAAGYAMRIDWDDILIVDQQGNECSNGSKASFRIAASIVVLHDVPS